MDCLPVLGLFCSFLFVVSSFLIRIPSFRLYTFFSYTPGGINVTKYSPKKYLSLKTLPLFPILVAEPNFRNPTCLVSIAIKCQHKTETLSLLFKFNKIIISLSLYYTNNFNLLISSNCASLPYPFFYNY